ncbi:MAG: HEAT repeat domain-containing protein, partial [Duncaniella sp.]|nr:HEAT repeat domain-containing protein [Duncaniella sp.]
MKTQIVTLILAAATCAGAWADVKIDKPVKGGNPTAFAIITDKATYEATAPAMKRYRDAVEADGLDTYIVSDEWADPTAVREAIKKLYASEPRLEGMVLVGDVPVAMVRNAQHFTTAFKMDEDNFPIHESSAPSDRFYDCLDLEFRFLQPDTTDSALFYYELTEDCPQKLEPTFYSARIRYPKERGGDKYEAISRFLDKAAKAKADMKNDYIDRVVSFNGHGYNSDCLIAWMDEEKAYRENFPEAFKTATGFKHWNFRMAEPMKYRLMEELERPGTDVFMFHEHGGPTTQYINGYGEAKTLDERLHH